MKRTIITILAIFFVVLSSHAYGAATYTVCASGCNYTTIQGALDGEDLAPDDIVEVRADTPGGSKTYSEMPTPEADDVGSSGQNIVVKARSGDTITINGFYLTQNYMTLDGFTITQSSVTWHGALHFNATGCIGQNLIIQDVTGAGTQAVLFYTSSSSNFLLNSTIRRTVAEGGMIDMMGTGDTVQDNDISNPNQNDSRDGIHISGDGNIIRGNYFHSWSWPATGVPHMDMIQALGFSEGSQTTNVLIEGNYVYTPIDQKTGASGPTFFMAQCVQGGTVRNNIAVVQKGILHYRNVGTEPLPSDLNIYNNTFIHGVPTSTEQNRGISLSEADGDDVRNNIIVDFRNSGGQGASILLVSTTNLTADYNLKYNTDDSTPAGQGEQANDVWMQDPLFIDGTGSDAEDYKISSISPARDAGTTIAGVIDDYEGNPRSAPYDIGAYEYTTSLSTPMPPSGLTVISLNGLETERLNIKEIDIIPGEVIITKNGDY